MKKYILLFLTACIFLSGCCYQQKSMFVLMPDPDGKVGKIIVKNAAGERTLTKAREASEVYAADSAPSAGKTLAQEEVQKLFKDALQAQPLPAERFILTFITGTANLTEDSKVQLPQVLDTVVRRQPCDVNVVGHTDTEGEQDKNFALGMKRAQRVKHMLIEQGVEAKQIQATSHGEIDPLVPTGDNVDEPRNRRVEIFVR